MTLYTTKAHIARATLDAVAMQAREVLDAMEVDSGVSLQTLQVDGGMTVNKLLMQLPGVNTPDFTEDDHWTVGRTAPQTGELVSVVPHMQDRLYFA